MKIRIYISDCVPYISFSSAGEQSGPAPNSKVHYLDRTFEELYPYVGEVIASDSLFMIKDTRFVLKLLL